MLRLIERFLRDYDVRTYSREDELLAYAQRHAANAVLLDINLGGHRSGVDVMRDLRKLDSYKKTPIQAVTAYALPQDQTAF